MKVCDIKRGPNVHIEMEMTNLCVFLIPLHHLKPYFLFTFLPNLLKSVECSLSSLAFVFLSFFPVSHTYFVTSLLFFLFFFAFILECSQMRCHIVQSHLFAKHNCITKPETRFPSLMSVHSIANAGQHY